MSELHGSMLMLLSKSGGSRGLAQNHPGADLTEVNPQHVTSQHKCKEDRELQVIVAVELL